MWVPKRWTFSFFDSYFQNMKIGSRSNSETSGEVDDMCINFSFEKILLTQAVETEKNTNISTIFQIQLFFHVQRLEIDLQQELTLFCTLWFVLWVSPSHAHRAPIFLFLCTLLLLQIRNKASYFSSCTACHIVVRNTCTAKRESFVHHQYVTLQFLGKDDFQSLEQHKLQSSSYNLGQWAEIVYLCLDLMKLRFFNTWSGWLRRWSFLKKHCC